MRVLVAPDKFKGSLDARGVAESIGEGILDFLPEASIDLCPLADGGEGTAEIISTALHGQWRCGLAHDALMRPIEVRSGWVAESRTAIIEASEAVGLRRLKMNERDPCCAVSFGLGEMIAAARAQGARKILVGLGGTSSNDGGFGMARALGFRFYADTFELTNGPGELSALTHFVEPGNFTLNPRIVAATDVRNCLLGHDGATSVFAEQKGATPAQMLRLEGGLARLAEVVARQIGRDYRNYPGAGAAGGLGFGLLSFCQAEVRSGFELVAKAVGLQERVAQANYIITGEGRLDRQTLEGKVPAGVARVSRLCGKKVYAIVGEIAPNANEASALFDDVRALATPPVDRTVAITHCRKLLRERAQELARTFVP